LRPTALTQAIVQKNDERELHMNFDTPGHYSLQSTALPFHRRFWYNALS